MVRSSSGVTHRSAHPTNRGSVGSLLSIGSAGSILSIGSAGSILSIGSAGSILSIGSAGSVLSIGSALSAASVGSVLSVGSMLAVLSAFRAGPAVTVGTLAVFAGGKARAKARGKAGRMVAGRLSR